MCNSTRDLNDAQLVTEFHNGNQKAFAEIYRRYCGELRNFAIKITSNEHVADDIVQQTFLDFAIFRDTIRQLRALLYKIATRRATDWERDCLKHRGLLHEPVDKQMERSDEVASKNEDIRRLLINVGQLLDEEQTALTAIYRDGLSYEKAAEQLNMRVGSVKSLISRAITSLRDKMVSTE
jgi:RNA polymerase sigma-70 factor (ECF subfamily)